MSPCFTFKYFAANLEFLKLLLTKALNLAKFTRAGLNLISKFDPRFLDRSNLIWRQFPPKQISKFKLIFYTIVPKSKSGI